MPRLDKRVPNLAHNAAACAGAVAMLRSGRAGDGGAAGVAAGVSVASSSNAEMIVGGSGILADTLAAERLFVRDASVFRHGVGVACTANARGEMAGCLERDGLHGEGGSLVGFGFAVVTSSSDARSNEHSGAASWGSG